MRYCPICDERYDDEIIKFCTKDGTPLVEDGKPNFVILPSQNPEEPAADFGEETVIRRKTAGSQKEPERIVVPTEQQVRSSRQVYYQPPEPPDTVKIIALTIIGTLVVLGFGAGLFWLFQKEPPAATNVNTNPINMNANLNTNMGFSSNFNFNTNYNTNANTSYGSNYNLNFNFNTNTKTPSPTPSPKQSPTVLPSPSVALSPSPTPKPANTRPANTNPSTSTTPRMGPRPPTMSNRPSGNN